MTSENLARYRNSPHMSFWRNLKEGYDAFEISKRLPSWDVCEGRYIFNAKGGPLNALGACPAGSTDPELMALVAAKQKTDFGAFELASAQLDEKDAQKVADTEARAAEKAAVAERTAAVNKAVSERTGAFTDAVGGFFSGLFGFDGQDANAAPVGPAPVPAPRIERG